MLPAYIGLAAAAQDSDQSLLHERMLWPLPVPLQPPACRNQQLPTTSVRPLEKHTHSSERGSLSPYSSHICLISAATSNQQLGPTTRRPLLGFAYNR